MQIGLPILHSFFYRLMNKSSCSGMGNGNDEEKSASKKKEKTKTIANIVGLNTHFSNCWVEATEALKKT